MADSKQGDPPPAPRVPARKALFLLLLGLGAALMGLGFAAVALLAPHTAAQLGRTAATLAGGGVFVASLGAPALKRQSLARTELAAFAERRGLTMASPDEARGAVASVTVAVRITYGSGPYKARGASGLLVHVRPPGRAASFTTDSEPFDEAEAVRKHLERLVDRTVTKSLPVETPA